MQERFALVALECLFDLGATVVYAVIAGLVIVGLVATDDGSMSVMTSVLYASVLPGAVLILIGLELAARVFGEWRTKKRQEASPRPSRLESQVPVGM